MCLGTIVSLVEVWDEGEARVGRLEHGAVVALAFVPEAKVGDRLLVHLGVPVEVLAPEDADAALALRESA
jgi:hydrogenase maturation factor